MNIFTLKIFSLRLKKRRNSEKLANTIEKIMTYNVLLAQINEKF